MQLVAGLNLTLSVIYCHKQEHNRVSSSMDGPYRRPPPKEDEIFAVLTQMGTNVIPQENIR